MDTSSIYSEPIRSEIYVDDPEFTSLFVPRIHKYAVVTDHVSVQCQLDMYGTEGVGLFPGCLNAHAGNFTSLCAPNCLPERLAIIGYAIEYAFLHDDDNDKYLDKHSAGKANTVLDQTLHQSGMTPDSTIASDSARRKAEVQAKIAAEFLRLDPIFGNWFMSYWRKWTKSTEDIRRRHFTSLDEYLEFRVIDAAGIWTLAILRWGTGIYLTPEEERTTGAINYAAYAELSLVNDLFSWDFEHKAHIESGGIVPLVNAVKIVMDSKMLTENAAKEVVRSEIKAHEERFCHLRDQYKATSTPSKSIMSLLDLLEHSMAGNFIWSIHAPRYRKSDRDLYHDHIATFGTERVKVLPQVFPSGSSFETTDDIDVVNLGHSKNQVIEDDIWLKTSLGSHSKDEPVMDPYTYINSLPSKNIRQTLIFALNSWYKVPNKSLLIIGDAINFLHNSSLLLDDIQDGSTLRRGNPVAHQIYGVGQTINTATYLMNEALSLINGLSEPAVSIYSEEIRNLHFGQGKDLHWSYHSHIPSLKDYIHMVDGKTGAFFRLITRLMKAEATLNRNLDLSHFVTLLGRYFQIRDDYQNLKSPDYTQQKGFCEDLDEGKISFPIILSMQTPGFPATALLSILRSRHDNRSISLQLKQYMLAQLTAKGVFSQARSVLHKLHAGLMDSIAEIEQNAGAIENWTVRLMIIKLAIDDGGRKYTERDESVWALNQKRAWAGYDMKTRPINQNFDLGSKEIH
ncbi:hypothetical protein N7540_003462 [Penicillium herquei]|nr:hypothetical protein N7540_003462 [Penicillium herquei]